jgi:hypothetical protein
MLAGVLLATALCSGCAAQTRSFRAQCEAGLAKGDVHVTTQAAPGLNINRSLSIVELTERDPPRAPRQKTLGLTTAKQGSEMKYEQNGLQDPDTKAYCMRPRFEVTLSYDPIEIFIAREFGPGSCSDHEVLRHEQRHVAAYRQHLAVAAQNLEQAMRAHFGDTIYYGDPALVQAELADAVAHRWLPLAQRELAAVDAIQQSIDSPQEYARYQSACHGEIVRVLSNLP